MVVTNSSTEQPIAITSVEDALEALKRPKGSFEEWFDCVGIFANLHRWEEMQIAAHRALESSTNRPLKPMLLKEAATRYAAGSLRDSKSQEEFRENCERSSTELQQFGSRIGTQNPKLISYFEALAKTLDEILLLLAENSPYALTSIASKLRKRLGRPDLAVTVATVAITKDKECHAAYTTRGAANSEMERYEAALSDFLYAEGDKKIKSRNYAIAGHTKLLIRQSSFKPALDIGWQIIKSGSRSKSILYLLAAAAKGAGDEERFKWLVKEAEKLPEVEQGSGEVLLMRQSIKVLIENKQFSMAEKLLNEFAVIASVNKYKSLQKDLIEAKRTATLIK